MKKSFPLFLFIGLISAQYSPEKITLERYPIMILPSDGAKSSQDIVDKITQIVASEATALNRFVVIDRTSLEKILAEQSLQLSGIVSDQDVVEIGKLATAREALLVHVQNFGQKGVPPESKEKEDEKDRAKAREGGLLGIIAHTVVEAAVDKAMEDVERYPNNIQTVIQAEVRKIDIETGQSVASFPIAIIHTGGNKEKSLTEAMKKVSAITSGELRRMYLLTSEVLAVQGNEVLLLLGQYIGVRPGLRFEVMTPPYQTTVMDRNITMPGRPVGLVAVTEVSSDASRAQVLRSWDRIEPGYRAQESLNPIVGASVNLGLSPSLNAYFMNVQGVFLPLNRFWFNGVFGLGTIPDSRDETDFNLEFGVRLGWNLLHHPQYSFGPSISLPLDLALRSDDDSHAVTAVYFAPAIGGDFRKMLSRSRDIVVGVRYVFTSVQGDWEYSKPKKDSDESETFPAVWIGKAPVVQPEGLYVTVGLRFLLF